MAKARDTDQAALEAFKNAFGIIVPMRNKDAKIRLGKVMIALEDARKALVWAEEVGFDQESLTNYREQYRVLKEEADQQGQEKSPDMSHLEALKDTCRHLADTIRKTRLKKKLNDLPQNSGIFVNDIPGLDNLNPQERQEKITEVRQKVCRGNALTNSLLQGDGEYDGVVPTKETVIDMCWYFKGMAQEKLGSPYQQGAMTIPDPDGRLAKFIDGCPDIYPRDSSHLKPQQRKGGSQGRGIDCGGAFPGGMNTVLLHPYVAENGERRLYVKFENAGAYGHLRTTKREVARRPENEQDKQQSKDHVKGVLSSGKGSGLEETREGTVDLAVKAAYQALYDAATGDMKQLLEPGKQKSKQNAQGKITGPSRLLSFTPFAPNYWDVQSQSANVLSLATELRKNPQQAKRLVPLIRDWQAAIRDAGYGTDDAIRMGDEVVLQQSDLKTVQSEQPHESDIDRDRGLITMLNLLEDRRAQQARLLEGTKKNIPYVYYKKLVFARPNSTPREFNDVLTLDTQVKQFEPYAARDSKVATGTVNKGTNLLKRKYFEYNGDVSQEEMFAALQATGWNMANLTRPGDLKKK